MRTAKLKALGIEIPLQEHEFYHDDGEVFSVVEHYNRLVKKVGAKEIEYDKRITNAKGVCQRITTFLTESREPIRKIIYIYYLYHDSPLIDLRVRAHEETHALAQFCGLDILAQRLLDEQGVKINFGKINQEIAANLGAIYALRANGCYKTIALYKKSQRSNKVV